MATATAWHIRPHPNDGHPERFHPAPSLAGNMRAPAVFSGTGRPHEGPYAVSPKSRARPMGPCVAKSSQDGAS